MNYVNIIQLKYPEYILTHAGTGNDYYALQWSDFNPSPNPIPKEILDADIAAAIASGVNGSLTDLDQSGQDELAAFANISGTTGLVKKVAHAMYTLDTNTYLTGITSYQVNQALGYTPYDNANPSNYTTKNYVDNLISGGIIWLSPVHAFNFVGTATVPPSNPNENESYIIGTAGNTGAWSSFNVGDRVTFTNGQWVFREAIHLGCRLGVCFDKTTTGIGDALGKDNYIGQIIGGTPGNWTWSWIGPINNDAVFNNLPNSTQFGQSYTYNSTTNTWIPFNNNMVGDGAGLGYIGNVLDVKTGKGIEIVSDKVTTKIYPSGGIFTTLDGSTESTSDNSALSLSPVGTAGIYTKVQVDLYGRITAGSTPTTLSGYSITDAVNTNLLGVAGGVATLDNTGKLPASQLPAYSVAWSNITSTPNTLSGYGIIDAVNSNLLGSNNGVATLDSNGKLTTSQIPSSLVGAVVYQGVWDADTNTPALASGVGTKGHYYKVSVAGSTSIDGLSQWNIGDVIIYNGTTWDKINGIASEVLSVSGRTGAVTLTSSDVGLGNVDNLKQLPYTQTMTFTGDVTSPSALLNTGTKVLTLATVNANIGTFNNLTVNAKGLVTAASNISYLTANQTITASGDVTGSGTTSLPLTLATVNSNIGSFGSATQVPTLTVNAKGLITAVSNTSIQIAESQVTNLTTDLASKIPLSTVTTAGDLIVATGNGAVTRLGIGASGRVLTSNGTTATWSTVAAGSMPWAQPITITGASGQPYAQVNSRTLTVVARFIFRGSSVIGTPSSIKAVALVASGTSNGQVLIQDITNNLTIATTGATINNLTFGIVTLGTISNVSTGDAIWEVQVNTAAGNISISALTINFN